jgi:ribosomal subunit interface protein
MRFRLHAHGFRLPEALSAYMQDRLDRLYDDFAAIMEGEVHLEEMGDKSPAREVRIHIRVPGEALHVSERANEYQTAFDAALGAIRRSLTRYKERLRS